MNFLAHSYLNFTDEQIVGQFLQDFIRNRERFTYPPEIRQGITLHREIDTFTDRHPNVSEVKEFFRPVVGLYAGAFVDVAFDYFLANSLNEKSLKSHAEKVYGVLNEHRHLLPVNLSKMLFYMERDNWLYNYRFDRGIQFSMNNVLRKATYLTEKEPVFEVFLTNKELIKPHFDQFFPELQRHCLRLNQTFI